MARPSDPNRPAIAFHLGQMSTGFSIRRWARSVGAGALLYGLLLVGALLTLLPLLWMLSASLMPAGEANSYPPRLWPSAITFEHYAALFTRLDLARYLLNLSLIHI